MNIIFIIFVTDISTITSKIKKTFNVIATPNVICGYAAGRITKYFLMLLSPSPWHCQNTPVQLIHSH